MDGFTLIETIATLTLVAILGALFIPYMGTAIIRSGESVQLLKQSFEINQVIEKLAADYRNEIETGTLNLVDFKAGLSSCDDSGNDVVAACSGLFLNYRASGNLIDIAPAGDSIYEAQESAGGGATPTDFLLVIVTKNNESTRVLFTK